MLSGSGAYGALRPGRGPAAIWSACSPRPYKLDTASSPDPGLTIGVMRRAIVFLLLCPPFWAQSQPPVDPSTLARAEGRVVNAATGEPLRQAQPTLHNGPGTDYTAVSDASGHFVTERIIPGSYNLTGEHQNFSVMDYGATRTAMPGRKINFTAGQSVADLEIKLVPFGVISGKVVDQDGDPVRRRARYRHALGLRPWGTPTHGLGRRRIDQRSRRISHL